MKVKTGEAFEIVIVDPHLREYKIMIPEENNVLTKLGKRQLWADQPVTIYKDEKIPLGTPLEIDNKWYLCGQGSDGKWYCSLLEQI